MERKDVKLVDRRIPFSSKKAQQYPGERFFEKTVPLDEFAEILSGNQKTR